MVEPVECPFGDPFCPCPDGDACHYLGLYGSPAMRPPAGSRTGSSEVTWEGLSPPYGTIVVDPPWPYEARIVGGNTPGAMRKAKVRPFPYSTMTVDEVCDLPVGDLAAGDSVLWLWTTNRFLPESFRVLKAWGFRYGQTLVWGKNNPMPVGSVAPAAAEFLLAARRGKPKMKWVWPSSVMVLPRPSARVHSVKPDAFGDLIEVSSPGPYVELFARAPRLGWDSWGHGYELPLSAEAGDTDG